MTRNELKQLAAREALKYVPEKGIVGIGTGSTTNFFIEALARIKDTIEGAVASSKASLNKLKALNIPVIDANAITEVDIYVDGADEFNADKVLIKGGGGALTGEKIIANLSKQFICIADAAKEKAVLGDFPLPIEVIPMARSAVARTLVKLGGSPVYRAHFISDYGNIILDVHNLRILNPAQLEQTLNQIPGVVTNGIFAQNKADIILVASDTGVTTL